ncbi:recombinase family protein [Streptomyces cacaoi]|uniref:recombinase family protein n=1 Tax=Streptomyces cacaoi TaxID=1898 RepID=UPI00260A4FA0|nr:recombinase family protein [Streptomyces cacaoi]
MDLERLLASPQALLSQRVTEVSTPGTGIPVGISLRVSDDKAQHAGAEEWREVGEQVIEQFKDLVHFARTLDEELEIIRIYNDNNTPATDPFLIREGFEACLRDLESATIRGVLFWHADRFARMDYDAARVNRIFLMHPDYIGRSVKGGTDLSTDDGRAWFTMQATMGGMEVSSLKRRTSTTNKNRAKKPDYQHGGRRPFGWEEDRKTLNAEEAADLLEAIRAIPKGRRVGEVRREWIAKGYVPERNKDSESQLNLSHSTVEQRLVNPRNCGYKTYLSRSDRRKSGRPWMPDHVVYEDGEPVIGEWETVCTPEEWAACVEELERRKADNREGRRKPHDTASKYLLSGTARCGICNFPLTFNPYTKGTNAYKKYGYRYACLTTHGGCGGVSRVGPPVEQLVEDAFLRRVLDGIGNASTDEPQIDESQYDGRLGEIQVELNEINARWKAKRISSGRALDMIEELESERSSLSKKRRKLLAQKNRKKVEGEKDLRWEDCTPGEKKKRLRKLIKAVIVHPVGRGRREFDPSAIEIVWQE